MKGLKRAWGSTVWSLGAVPHSEGRVASDIRRGLLPVFDLLLIATSIMALRGGMPTFELVYPEAVATVASWGLLITSTLCLVGVVFPKLWPLEFAAKVGMFTVLFGYAVAMLVYSIEEPQRGYTGGVMLAICVVPVWRVVWIGRERRGRRSD